MSAKDFLDRVAEPDVVALEQDYGDERTAYHAVHSVDALAAHIYHDLISAGHVFLSTTRDDLAFRESLAQSHADFALLRDLAKALKHVRLTRGNPEVSQASQVSPRRLGWDQMRWDEARSDSPPQVVVETNSGDFRPIETIARTSLDMLKSLMKTYSLA